MNTLEAIAKRKSTRAFTSRQIPEEALQAILKAGCAAPVAMAQYEALYITVVQDKELLKKYFDNAAEVVFQQTGTCKIMYYGEPTTVIVSSAQPLRPGMDFTNAGCIIENMVLAATDLGIDSVVLAGAPSALALNMELQKELGIPEGFKPILGASFGYGTEETPVKEHTITINRI